MIPKEELHLMYWDEGMSISEIGKVVGVGSATIYRWMKSYNIPRRTISESQIGCDVNIPSKEDLYRMYWDENMSIPEIEKFVGVGNTAIRNLMKSYNIPRRTISESQIGCDVNIPSKEDLYRMYWDENMSTGEIAKVVGVNRGVIYGRMKKYDIPMRTISESIKGPNHWNWLGGPKKYCYKFDEQLREAVRERDYYTCQNCGKTQEDDYRKLSVHHVHYDAENCYPDLISLCQSCHNSSNSNRDWWETHYMCILLGRGLLDWKPSWSE